MRGIMASTCSRDSVTAPVRGCNSEMVISPIAAMTRR
jgi:hypothetical protein